MTCSGQKVFVSSYFWHNRRLVWVLRLVTSSSARKTCLDTNKKKKNFCPVFLNCLGDMDDALLLKSSSDRSSGLE